MTVHNAHRSDAVPASSVLSGARDASVALVADEHALLVAIRAGDEGAFEIIFRAHYGALCDFADRYLRSADAAEEIVQDVLWSVWASRASLAITGSLTHYLHGAVRNKALNRLRRVAVEARYAAELGRELPEVPESGTGDECGDDRAALLDGAIARLAQDRRELFLLRWRHQLSYAEIGELTGRSVKAVEIQLYRILKSLREAVGTLPPREP